MNFESEVRLVEAAEKIGTALKYLGTGDASSPMGAVEFLAKEVKEGSAAIAMAIEHLAEAVDRRGA